jgi:Fe-S-cluster-containing hydrogenase component 2
MKMIKVITENCTGCRLCEVTCSFVHFRECAPELSRIRVKKEEERGEHIIILCMQCADAPCIDACPVDALNRDDETGVVIVDGELCIGCGDCKEACPIGAAFMHSEEEVALICDLCSGDPECLKVCSREALSSVDAEINDPSRKLFMDRTSEQLLRHE